MTTASDDHRQAQRTSVYLVRRAEALLGALRFFSGAAHDASRRRLQFLTQSDFWEWEIDNLIYSFVNLGERQKTWGASKAAVEKLGQLGIAVDAKVITRIRWKGHWESKEENRRVAPMDLLRETIDEWNRLIGLVEQEFIRPMRDKAEKWNIQTRRDLKAMKKSMPSA